MTKRKWAWGMGIAAMIAVGFWMRALASWRPQTFARVNFNPTRILFSRDGKRLIVADASGNSGDKQIFSWKSGAVDVGAESLGEFDGDFYGAKTYPRVWFDVRKKGLYFSPSLGRKIYLQGRGTDGMAMWSEATYSWSKARREVYGEWKGEIWAWDWETGENKRLMRYVGYANTSVAFSPDARWLIARGQFGEQWKILRVDVRSGKVVQTLPVPALPESFDWSPDGAYLGCTWKNSWKGEGFVVLRTRDWKSQWSCEGKCTAKWVLPQRVGVARAKGFEWRDASGNVTRRLSGPCATVADWALSPDSEWIYSVKRNGLIQRWRAR